MTFSPSVYMGLSSWLRGRVFLASLIILFCSAGPRVFLAWQANPDQSLIEQEIFLDHEEEPEVTRTPGYSALLAALLLLTGQDLLTAMIVQALVLSWSVLILYWLARYILPPVMAFTGGLLAAFSPWGATLAGLPLSDGIFLGLLSLIFFAIRLTEGVSNPIVVILGGACIGLLTGTAVLVRPILPLVLLVAVTLFWRYGPRRKGVWILLTAMMVCTFTPLYLLVLSDAELSLRSLPDVLTPARPNFYGELSVLALLWGGLLILAYLGYRCSPDQDWDDGEIERNWLLTILVICLLLTLSSGSPIGQGSRLYTPLELIVPLLVAVGLVRIIRAFQQVPPVVLQESSAQVLIDQRPILSILIPVYNEVHTVEPLIEKVLSSPVNMELRLFVVDDCSTDGSGVVLDRLAAADPRIMVLHHTANRGKGAAIRTSIQVAQGDFAIIQDADFEYDPCDYPRIIAPLLRGDAEAVFGSRYLNSGERHVLRYWHSLGNAMLTTFFNILHNIYLTDMETCYKAMSLKLLKNLRLTTDRFGIEPEIAARLIALRVNIIEVPIRYNARSYQQGKKIGWRDAIDAFYTVIKFKYFDTTPCIDAGMVRHLIMAEAPRYQKVIAREIKPFLGQRVLDVGAGVGNLARQLADTKELILTEPAVEYRRQLAANMRYRNNVIISDHDMFSCDSAVWSKSVRPDTLLCINQLEHLRDDKQALARLVESIEPGGTIIIIVACHPFLYGSLDQALKRQRRYDANTLRMMLGSVGLKIEYQKWLGKLVMVGWFIESKISRCHFFSHKPVALVNIFSPIIQVLDNLLPCPGLSLLIVARKSL